MTNRLGMGVQDLNLLSLAELAAMAGGKPDEYRGLPTDSDAVFTL